eukprot:9695847-Prorocentrum_lima.AAC.1
MSSNMPFPTAKVGACHPPSHAAFQPCSDFVHPCQVAHFDEHDCTIPCTVIPPHPAPCVSSLSQGMQEQ